MCVRFCWIPSHPWSRYRPIGKCPLYRFEATGQLLHSAVVSNQVGCSCTWQRSLSRETNTGASKEIPAFNQSQRGCNHPTSNWSYKGHKVPYLVPRTIHCLSSLWSYTGHWPYAPGVCSVTRMLWRILHSWLIEYSLRENSRDLHNGIPARSGILLCDMMQFGNFNWPTDLDNIMELECLFGEWEQHWDTSTCVGQLICPEGRVSSLNKSNPIHQFGDAGVCLGHCSMNMAGILLQSPLWLFPQSHQKSSVGFWKAVIIETPGQDTNGQGQFSLHCFWEFCIELKHVISLGGHWVVESGFRIPAVLLGGPTKLQPEYLPLTGPFEYEKLNPRRWGTWSTHTTSWVCSDLKTRVHQGRGHISRRAHGHGWKARRWDISRAQGPH